MIPLRGLLPLFVIAALAALSGWLYQQVQQQHLPADGSQRHDPDAFAEDFDLSTFDADGRLVHRLWAKRMDHYPDDDSSALAEPYLELYRPDSKPWQVRALQGWVSTGGTEVLLENQVKIHRPASAQQAVADIHTNKLRIFPDRDFAETDIAINYRSTGLKVEAVGMRAYLDQGRVELLDRVRAVQQPQGTP
ncbi:MAG TPA: LPS export ABC transporter periplasmic protein LptC [Gammaproteobacteria bacterium]|nr:LPS export ABC transporter periplasmic protein LptC [Gammaproteobacteria bacterium]